MAPFPRPGPWRLLAVQAGGRVPGVWLGPWDGESGDILRGGAAAPIRQTDASTGTALKAQQQARASQRDALARTAQSLQAVRAMQAQARATSLQGGAPHAGADPNHPGSILPNVPEGLARRSPSTGAPRRRPGPGAADPRGPNARHHQADAAAGAAWTGSTFNVGRADAPPLRPKRGRSGGGPMDRLQPGQRSERTAHRRSSAGSAPPARSMSSTKTASSSAAPARSMCGRSWPRRCPINDNLIQRGLLNNPDSQFLFSALPIPAGSKGTPAFTPPAVPPAGQPAWRRDRAARARSSPAR